MSQVDRLEIRQTAQVALDAINDLLKVLAENGREGDKLVDATVDAQSLIEGVISSNSTSWETEKLCSPSLESQD